MALPTTCKVTKTHSLKKGDVLFYEGTPASEMFYLESGKLRITKRILNKNIRLGELMEGEFLGEVAVLGGGTRSATVRASTDSTVLALDRKHCNQCFSNIPSCVRIVMEALAQRLRQADELVIKIARIHELINELAVKIQMLESTLLEEEKERGSP
ncbi:MAG TPA: Crp/Fnr family transcriptional regulator [Candidatus Hypogeohydataceae bacterium YC41]